MIHDQFGNFCSRHQFPRVCGEQTGETYCQGHNRRVEPIEAMCAVHPSVQDELHQFDVHTDSDRDKTKTEGAYHAGDDVGHAALHACTFCDTNYVGTLIRWSGTRC